jgi:hypothetical protein
VNTVIYTGTSASITAAKRCWPSTRPRGVERDALMGATNQSPRRIASPNARTVDRDNGRFAVFAANISAALTGVLF